MTAKILKENAKLAAKGAPWYMHASMIASILLIVVSFFIPPYAVVDSSVLAATGELMGGATLMNFLANLPAYREAGEKAKMSQSTTSISVAADEVEEEAENL